MLRQVRPFTGPLVTNAAVPCRVRVLRVHYPHTQHNALPSRSDEAEIGSSANLPVAFCVALGALGLTTSYALAAEVAASTTDYAASGISAEDVETLAASSSGNGFEQIMVSLLFGVVVVLLSIVTGGVLYINIKQFLDGRQEVDDKEKQQRELKVMNERVPAKGKGSEDGEDDVVSLKRASRVKKEKGKGFAQSEFTSRR